LLFGEGHGRRRRRFLGDHLPAHDGGGRRFDAACGCGLRSEHGLAGGNDGNPGGNRSAGELLGVHRNRDLGDGLRSGKCALGNDGHGSLNTSIGIGYVGDVGGFIDDGGVIDVGDHRGVDDGVAYVDLSHVSTADLVGRNVDFARSERKPADIAAPASGASTDEDNERGSVDGAHIDRAGNPSPAAAYEDPASVVERRVTPGRVIDPGVSPRRNPIPMAGVIRRPADGNLARIPDMAVGAIVAPLAILIEIFEANDVAREIERGARLVVASVAAIGPAVEGVGIAKGFNVGVKRISAAEGGLLSGVEVVGLPAASRLAIAVAQGDDGVCAVGAGIDAIASGLSDGEGEVGRIDFEIVVGIELAYPNVDCSRRKLDLDGVIIEIEERDTGVLAEAYDGGTELQFGARGHVRPELVAGGHGAVRDSSDPISGTCGLERNRAVEVTETSDAGGRVVLGIVLGGALYRKEYGCEGQKQGGTRPR
jgi:hypothetical protein